MMWGSQRRLEGDKWYYVTGILNSIDTDAASRRGSVRYILKPVLWNSAGYQKPSGIASKDKDSFVGKHGFGHEEWNNSSRLEFDEKGLKMKAFHTEGVGKAAIAPGSAFVFMYASHDGIQELVGIGGLATCLADDEFKSLRNTLVQKLKLGALASDAWSHATVKQCFENDKGVFERLWNGDLHWIPNWTCPAETYFWPDRSTRLEANQITGKTRLNSRFKSHTEIQPMQALAIMDQVPASARNKAWFNIRAAIDREPFATAGELRQIETNVRGQIETSATALTKIRLGQAKFRTGLDQIWEEACAVTGCNIRATLRASHIKPWGKSSNSERLDANNGLLLKADLDALFDGGLITFESDGTMVVSSAIELDQRKLLGLPKNISQTPSEGQKEYLNWHKENLFRK
jgi:hypothetical protein